MTRPLVSVVIPCHNAEPFVAETIESVLAQSYPAELVVVDDASSDAGWDVVQGYAERFPDRVRATRLPENRGGCHARNVGAAMARGDFLMFLDADDLITPGTLEALVNALGEPRSVAFCPWFRFKQDAAGEWRRAPADAPLPQPDADTALRGWLEGTAWTPPCAVLWRRDAYELTGGWDESLALNQDGDIMQRALALGARPVRAAGGEALYRWHESPTSVSQSFTSERKLRSFIRVLDKLAALLEGQGRQAAFASSLGLGYHGAALIGFRNGHTELARDCLRRGESLAGRRAVSPTAAGRLVVRVLGMERKEKLVQALARLGVMSRQRKRGVRLRTSAGDAR